MFSQAGRGADVVLPLLFLQIHVLPHFNGKGNVTHEYKHNKRRCSSIKCPIMTTCLCFSYISFISVVCFRDNICIYTKWKKKIAAHEMSYNENMPVFFSYISFTSIVCFRDNIPNILSGWIPGLFWISDALGDSWNLNCFRSYRKEEGNIPTPFCSMKSLSFMLMKISWKQWLYDVTIHLSILLNF